MSDQSMISNGTVIINNTPKYEFEEEEEDPPPISHLLTRQHSTKDENKSMIIHPDIENNESSGFVTSPNWHDHDEENDSFEHTDNEQESDSDSSSSSSSDDDDDDDDDDDGGPSVPLTILKLRQQGLADNDDE
eukprot:45885_1